MRFSSGHEASCLAAIAGLASAQGVAVTGFVSMGVLGGDRVDDGANDTSYELHADIDVKFAMSGQNDIGLTFGASIDPDESDGDGSEGASNAFGNRTQGGEDIFISGAFGTLAMGDTDGALDWTLQEIAIGGSLGDVHTTHGATNRLGSRTSTTAARSPVTTNPLATSPWPCRPASTTMPRMKTSWRSAQSETPIFQARNSASA